MTAAALDGHRGEQREGTPARQGLPSHGPPGLVGSRRTWRRRSLRSWRLKRAAEIICKYQADLDLDKLLHKNENTEAPQLARTHSAPQLTRSASTGSPLSPGHLQADLDSGKPAQTTDLPSAPLAGLHLADHDFDKLVNKNENAEVPQLASSTATGSLVSQAHAGHHHDVEAEAEEILNGIKNEVSKINRKYGELAKRITEIRKLAELKEEEERIEEGMTLLRNWRGKMKRYSFVQPSLREEAKEVSDQRSDGDDEYNESEEEEENTLDAGSEKLLDAVHDTVETLGGKKEKGKYGRWVAFGDLWDGLLDRPGMKTRIPDVLEAIEFWEQLGFFDVKSGVGSKLEKARQTFVRFAAS